MGLHEVVVAVSGCQRITSCDTMLDESHQLRWDALESLRRIHDCGVLHGNVETRKLFVQSRPEVGISQVLLCVSCGRKSAVDGWIPVVHQGAAMCHP